MTSRIFQPKTSLGRGPSCPASTFSEYCCQRPSATGPHHALFMTLGLCKNFFDAVLISHAPSGSSFPPATTIPKTTSQLDFASSFKIITASLPLRCGLFVILLLVERTEMEVLLQPSGRTFGTRIPYWKKERHSLSRILRGFCDTVRDTTKYALSRMVMWQFQILWVRFPMGLTDSLLLKNALLAVQPEI